MVSGHQLSEHHRGPRDPAPDGADRLGPLVRSRDGDAIRLLRAEIQRSDKLCRNAPWRSDNTTRRNEAAGGIETQSRTNSAPPNGMPPGSTIRSPRRWRPKSAACSIGWGSIRSPWRRTTSSRENRCLPRQRNTHWPP